MNIRKCLRVIVINHYLSTCPSFTLWAHEETPFKPLLGELASIAARVEVLPERQIVHRLPSCGVTVVVVVGCRGRRGRRGARGRHGRSPQVRILHLVQTLEVKTRWRMRDSMCLAKRMRQHVPQPSGVSTCLFWGIEESGLGGQNPVVLEPPCRLASGQHPE